MSSLKTIILSLRPRLRVLVPPCCVHRDRRPDLTVSGAPSPRFVLFVFSSFVLFLCFVSRGKRVRWPRALMPADRGRYPPPAVAIPSPPAGSLVPGLPLPQARRWLNARRPATDSMPAGPPLTQCPPARRWLNARRPASDSSPPDRLWLKPAGSPLTQACRIAPDSCPPAAANPSPWIQSTRHGQESRVCVLLCPQEHFNQVLSSLVHGDSFGAGGSSCCGRGGLSSRLPPCRGSGCWGTLWGPLMSCHAQKKPQLPSLA